MGRRKLIRDPPIRRRIGIGRRGTIIQDPRRTAPPLPPSPRARFGLPVPTPRRRVSTDISGVGRPRPRPRPRPSTDISGVGRPRPAGDFGVLQPAFFGDGRRPRPTRVEVAQPSGRKGRLITVSSRSILARGRKKKKLRKRRKRLGKGQIKKKRRRQLPPQPAVAFPRRRVEASPFVPFQEISFGEGRRREGRRGEFEEEERPRQRRAPPRRRRAPQSDFDVLNLFA